MKYVFILLLLSVLLSCKPPLTEGEITAKVYEPAQTRLIMHPMVTTDGKNTRVYYVPMSVYDDADWIIYIKNYDGETERTNYFYVSQDVYNGCQVGDWFVFDKSMGRMDDPDIKTRKNE